MRQVVLDTETTGIDPAKGHRIIEIGCVELINRKLTGNHFHVSMFTLIRSGWSSRKRLKFTV